MKRRSDPNCEDSTQPKAHARAFPHTLDWIFFFFSLYCLCVLFWILRAIKRFHHVQFASLTLALPFLASSRSLSYLSMFPMTTCCTGKISSHRKQFDFRTQAES